MSESVSAFDIAASGMAAQRTQMDAIAANLAHADVAPNAAAPYRAQTAVFESSNAPADDSLSFTAMLDAAAGDTVDDVSFGDEPIAEGVRFAGYAEQTNNEPVDTISQMISLISSGRAYDADVSALQAAKQMDVESIDIGQG